MCSVDLADQIEEVSKPFYKLWPRYLAQFSIAAAGSYNHEVLKTVFRASILLQFNIANVGFLGRTGAYSQGPFNR